MTEYRPRIEEEDNPELWIKRLGINKDKLLKEINKNKYEKRGCLAKAIRDSSNKTEICNISKCRREGEVSNSCRHCEISEDTGFSFIETFKKFMSESSLPWLNKEVYE